MKTLEITHFLYDDVATIDKKLQQELYDCANDNGVEIIGLMSIAHIEVAKRIMSAIQKKYNVKLIAKREEYYYIYGNIEKDRWAVIDTTTTNIISIFREIHGNDNLWKGKDLETLSNNAHLLKDDAVKVFQNAISQNGDVVIFDGQKFSLVEYGILHFFKHENRAHALIKKNKLPNGKNSSAVEIREIVRERSNYDWKIVESELDH